MRCSYMRQLCEGTIVEFGSPILITDLHVDLGPEPDGDSFRAVKNRYAFRASLHPELRRFAGARRLL